MTILYLKGTDAIMLNVLLSRIIRSTPSFQRRFNTRRLYQGSGISPARWRQQPSPLTGCSSNHSQPLSSKSEMGELVDFSPLAEEDLPHFRVVPCFSTSEEERHVLKEISKSFRGKKYQYDHWDGVSAENCMLYGIQL